jgi:hypothetical protein
MTDTYTTIVCAADPLLTVYIDRSRPTAGVFYKYDDQYDGGADQSTPYQTADRPADDQQAAAMVNAWLS